MKKCAISYQPLFDTLKEKRMKISDLRRNRGEADLLHPTIIAAINRNEPVNMQHIVDICCYLNVPIEKVVRIE